MNQSDKSLVPTDILVILVFLVLGASMIWQTADKIYSNYELQQRVNELEAEIAILEIQNQNLTYSIDYYKTDTFLELEAREKFNKAKPGEKVALLPKDRIVENPQPINDQEDIKQPQYKSNFSAWMDFLFGSIN